MAESAEVDDAQWRAFEEAREAAAQAAEAAEAAEAEAEEERRQQMAIRRAKIALLEGCARAAKAINAADVLMLCTGAGFSADSGLAVYGDIARIPAYSKRHLKYHDICDPQWLEMEPSLFYGFWGTCFNDYRSTKPHRGYEIIAAWRDRLFRDSVSACEIQKRVISMKANGTSMPEFYQCTGYPGAFFVFTSNVDAHSFDHFNACEVRECHGNTELWQCSSGESCCKLVWRAPLELSFRVNLETMLAPAEADDLTDDPNLPTQKAKASDANGQIVPDDIVEGDDQSAPRAGRVRRQERVHMLRGWPPLVESSTLDVTKTSFANPNRPICVKCGELARPAILMFGDFNWVDDDAQEHRYNRWLHAVEAEAKARAPSKTAVGDASPLKVCVLEIGCGKNVPTCRENSKHFGRRMTRAGAVSTLIRINHDYPGADVSSMIGGGEVQHIPLRGGGLECILEIDAAMADPAKALANAAEMLAELEAEETRKGQQPQLTEEALARLDAEELD